MTAEVLFFTNCSSPCSASPPVATILIPSSFTSSPQPVLHLTPTLARSTQEHNKNMRPSFKLQTDYRGGIKRPRLCLGVENVAGVCAALVLHSTHFLQLMALTVQVAPGAINRVKKSIELLGFMLVLVSSREMICCR